MSNIYIENFFIGESLINIEQTVNDYISRKKKGRNQHLWDKEKYLLYDSPIWFFPKNFICVHGACGYRCERVQ